MQQTRRPSARRTLFAIVGVAALGLAGCGDSDDTSSGGGTDSGSEENSLSVEMKDYSYSIDGDILSGRTSFEMSNTGDEYHMVALGKFKDGKGMDDLQEVLDSYAEEMGGEGGGEGEGGDPSTSTTEAALARTAEPELQLIAQTSPSSTTSTTAVSTEPDGGAGGEGGGEEEEGEDPLLELFDGELGAPGGFMAPGGSGTVTVEDLEAGDYAMICYLGDEEGTPHFASGMVGEFTVADEESDAKAPKADHTVTVGESDSGLPKTLKAGEVTFKVDAGGDDHEFGVVRLQDEDTDFAEVDEYFAAAFEQGEEFVTRDNLDDQVAILSAYSFDFDDTLYLTVDLEPGTYFIGCAFEDDDDGHGEDEMVKVTVT